MVTQLHTELVSPTGNGASVAAAGSVTSGAVNTVGYKYWTIWVTGDGALNVGATLQISPDKGVTWIPYFTSALTSATVLQSEILVAPLARLVVTNQGATAQNITAYLTLS